jgi:hypothetical protein
MAASEDQSQPVIGNHIALVIFELGVRLDHTHRADREISSDFVSNRRSRRIRSIALYRAVPLSSSPHRESPSIAVPLSAQS